MPTSTGLPPMPVPVGAIVAYLGDRAPPGWMLCDGGKIPQDAAHKELLAMFPLGHVPDLRGYFLRGFDSRPDGQRVDPDQRKLGSIQTDTTGKHAHTYAHAHHAGRGKSGADSTAVFADHTTGTTSDTGPGIGGETRPKNIAVNYIVRAERWF